MSAFELENNIPAHPPLMDPATYEVWKLQQLDRVAIQDRGDEQQRLLEQSELVRNARFGRLIFALEHAHVANTTAEARTLLALTKLDMPGPIQEANIPLRRGAFVQPKKPYHPFNLLTGEAAGSQLCGIVFLHAVLQPTGFSTEQEKELIATYRNQQSAAKLGKTIVRYGPGELTEDAHERLVRAYAMAKKAAAVQWLTGKSKTERHDPAIRAERSLIARYANNAHRFHKRNFGRNTQKSKV